MIKRNMSDEELFKAITTACNSIWNYKEAKKDNSNDDIQSLRIMEARYRALLDEYRNRHIKKTLS